MGVSEPVRQHSRTGGTSARTRTRAAGATVRRVLIADDHADTRIILRHYLEAFGLGVCEAADGEEALQQMRETPADAVILDMQMPRLDGLAVIESMRADGELAAIPVVVLTGDLDGIPVARAAGADECLTKPAHPRALYETVESLLSDRGR